MTTPLDPYVKGALAVCREMRSYGVTGPIIFRSTEPHIKTPLWRGAKPLPIPANDP